jgi:hypothetical protein
MRLFMVIGGAWRLFDGSRVKVDMLEAFDCILESILADGIAFAVRADPAVLKVNPNSVSAGSLVRDVANERVASDASDVALELGVGGFDFFFGDHGFGGASISLANCSAFVKHLSTNSL